jgi:hypothetical protein
MECLFLISLMKLVRGIDGSWIKNGAIDYWQAEVDSLKNDADALMSFIVNFQGQNLMHLEMKVNNHYLILQRYINK